MDIKFELRPAEMFDLFRVIICGYNYEDFADTVEKAGITPDPLIIDAFQYIWDGMDKSTPGLALFFTTETGKHSLATHMFEQLICKMGSIDELIDFIKNIDPVNMKKSLLEFYNDVSKRDEAYDESLLYDEDKLYSFVNNLKISSILKWEIVSFINKSEIIIEPLIVFLSDMKNKIRFIYTKHKKMIKEFEKKINTKIKINKELFLLEEFSKISEMINFYQYDKIFISFSFFNEIIFYTLEEESNIYIFLGMHYEKIIDLNKTGISIDQMENFFKVLSDHYRLKIITMLMKREMFSGEIARALDMKYQITSYHLDLLRNAGLIINRNEGKQVYYRINIESIERWFTSSKLQLLTKDRS